MGLERFLGAGGSAHRHQRHGTHSLRARCVPAPSARQPRTHSIARLTLPAAGAKEAARVVKSVRSARNLAESEGGFVAGSLLPDCSAARFKTSAAPRSGSAAGPAAVRQLMATGTASK